MTREGFRYQSGMDPLRDPISAPTATINLSRVLAALRRRRRSIAFSVAGWLCLGMFYLATTPRYFDASSQVLLDANIDRTIRQVSTTSDMSTTDGAMESARLVITSDAVISRVVDRLDLQDDPAFMSPPQALTRTMIRGAIDTVATPIRKLRDLFDPGMQDGGASSAAVTEEGTPPQTDEARNRVTAIDELRKSVVVHRIGQSTAFGIEFRWTDSKVAAEIVNTFADVYVADVLNANYAATERMTEWMRERLSQLEEDARAAAQAAEQFRARNGLVSARDSTMSQDAVNSLNVDLSEAIAEQARAAAQVAALKKIVEGGRDGLVVDDVLVGLPASDDPDFTKLRTAMMGALTNLTRAKLVYGDDAAQIAASQKRVDNTGDLLFASLRRLLGQARSDLTLASAKVDALQSSLDKAVGDDAKNGPALVRLRALEQRADTLSALYQSFLSKFQEIDQQKSFPVSNVRILNLAETTLDSAGPSTKIILALCVVLGLLTGLLIAAIREWRDRFVRTADHVTNHLDAHFLGYLPRIEKLYEKPRFSVRTLTARLDREAKVISAPKAAVYALTNMRSKYTETLRNIRLASRLASANDESCLLGLTSAKPGEGKSITALNLAAVIASTGNSVVLVDADPHRSGLSHHLGLKTEKGLLDILTGRCAWEEVLLRLGETEVDLIPGLVPKDFPHTSEILSSSAFHEMLDALKWQYDYVILDLAPMAPVIDVRSILKDLDQLVIVSEFGRISRGLLEHLLDSDPLIRAKLLGIVLNKVDLTQLKDYVDDSDTEAHANDYEVYYGRP